MQTLFTSNAIPNKHAEKVKSNKEQTGEKLGCAFCISFEYKFIFFFGKLQNYFISCGENISIFTRAMRSDFFIALDEIYLVFTSKK